jgi:predicted short-subunit dehydrogenase-like oxidoreductase (DUF2520 family)
MKKSKAETFPMSVIIIGAGKVGAALALEVRKRGGSVKLYSARKFKPKTRLDCDLLILAVRDRELGALAEQIAANKTVTKKTACVHVAGSLTAEVLAPLRAVSAGVAQMHPMISFASTRKPPRLDGGHVHVRGDKIAETRAKKFARALGMTPRTFENLDTVGYHAAAGLVANGAAALAAIGARVLEKAGVPAKIAPLMLGPILASVADNVTALGFPNALTGPIRRGDPNAVAKHLALLAERLPDAVPLFVAAGLAQIPLARALHEAPAEGFDAIEKLLRKVSLTQT